MKMTPQDEVIVMSIVPPGSSTTASVTSNINSHTSQFDETNGNNAVQGPDPRQRRVSFSQETSIHFGGSSGEPTTPGQEQCAQDCPSESTSISPTWRRAEGSYGNYSEGVGSSEAVVAKLKSSNGEVGGGGYDAGGSQGASSSRSRRRKSSLDLRRLPDHILLMPNFDVSEYEGEEDDLQFDSQSKQSDIRHERPKCWKSLMLCAFCLSNKYRLKTQLMMSFGCVNLLTILLVMMVFVSTCYVVGDRIKGINQEEFETLFIRESQPLTVRYLAEALEKRFMPVDLVDLLHEAAQDRFQGYPNSLFDDNMTPFRDIYSGRNIYPVKGPPMIIDWQVQKDVNESNFQEHSQQSRYDTFLKTQRAATTANAMFMMQGVCDPNDVDETSPNYWPNCTALNNNITTGGAIHPVPTTGPIYNMASDITPLVKAMYEANSAIRDLGLYFRSMGAGASITFPGYPATTQTTYESVGCEWLATPNPIDSSLGPIGKPGELTRCRPEGEMVSSRLYNPMERGWCRDQALNPHKTFLDTYIDAFNDNHWILSIGRAMYDRLTNEFVACSYIGISLSFIEQSLKGYTVTDNSQVSVVRFDSNGTVVASTATIASAGETDSDAYTIDQLSVGLTRETYQQLFQLVDYESSDTWEPISLRTMYEDFSLPSTDGFLVTASPIPRIPDYYDAAYRPNFFVISAIFKEDVFTGVDDLNQAVDSNTRGILWFSLAAGAIGLLVSTVVIVLMANALASPLNYINAAADDIVKSFGMKSFSEVSAEDAGKDDHDDSEGSATPKDTNFDATKLCTPKTELNDVLKEFNKLVASFSGSLLARSEKVREVEIPNRGDIGPSFSHLYSSRSNPTFKYNLEKPVPGLTSGDDKVEDASLSDPGFINLGSNLNDMAGSVSSRSLRGLGTKRGDKSRLFLWTVALIATPLLVTTAAICAIVIFKTQTEFGESVEDAESHLTNVRRSVLSAHAALRAELVASLVDVSIRDTYLLTRYFGWLFFGGIERADSFTEMIGGVNECKEYNGDLTMCPFWQETYHCDCAWNDNRSSTCENYPNFTSRYFQQSMFTVESSDSLSDGDRNVTSFPKVATSPESTEWWSNLTAVPGWEKGSNASGHDTLYDRLRVASAMPLFPVLYNYDKLKESNIGHFIAFESDGLILGYTGCNSVSLASNSFWSSSEANGAASFRPELCPIGKFGYDPRCRDWYHSGRDSYMRSNESLHITPPYAFAVSNRYGQSATSPLVDPHTGEHVGQILNDFLSNSVFEALNPANTPLATDGFPVLIAVQGDPEENTVIGPDYAIGDEAKEISEVVLKYDHNCTEDICKDNIKAFKSIVKATKEVALRSVSFHRTTSTGETETVYLAEAPVVVRNLRPVDASNFARGIEENDYHVYSLALCETRPGLLQAFQRMENNLSTSIRFSVLMIAIGVAVAAVFIIFISYLVTSSISESMLYLLNLVRSINKLEVDEEPPIIENSIGSKEIVTVCDTVLILFRIVRTANDFFYDGELEMAYIVLVDALKVFRKLDNKKAIAVASNNLGNIMLHMYNEITELELPTHCGLSKREIISRGMLHFHEAISLGEKAYDEFYEAEGWTPNCLDFMQHLANRYFNRAFFLLSIKDDHDQPEKIEELGLRDLEIARDMDFEIVEYGEDVGFNRENRAHKRFQVNVCRARGHNQLLEMGYPDNMLKEKGYPEEWEVEERLDDAFRLLQAENKRETSKLFEGVNVVGRMQQIEAELMRYKMVMGDLHTAAKIAVRLLKEDAYLFSEAVSAAVKVLLAYVDSDNWDEHGDENKRKEIKHLLSSYSKDIEKDLESSFNNDNYNDSNNNIEETNSRSGSGSRNSSSRASTRVSRISVVESLAESIRTRISSEIDSDNRDALLKLRAKQHGCSNSSSSIVLMEDF